MAEIIHFSGTGEEYGCFSNFAAYPIRLGGKVWPTSEYYFQARKFEDRTQQEAICKATWPMIAARPRRTREGPILSHQVTGACRKP